MAQLLAGGGEAMGSRIISCGLFHDPYYIAFAGCHVMRAEELDAYEPLKRTLTNPDPTNLRGLEPP